MSRIKGRAHRRTGGDGAKVNKSKLLALALGAWITLEIVVFALVVRSLGVFATILLGLGTTFIGLSDVKRVLSYLRARLGRTKRGDGVMLDGALQALGSLLLILPGFASDIAGLALKSPSIRENVSRRLRERDKPGGPRTIDLAPGEWKIVAQKKKRKPRAAAIKRND